MTSLDVRVNEVRKYLSGFRMYAVDDWLAGCVEYLCGDGGTQYTQAEINNLAKEQWLLNDLKEICPGSLPPNLKDVVKTELRERFILQINGTMDVGTPAYQQYQKLQKVNLENIEETSRHEDKISNHRMIKLHLTDGTQDVTAIEYKPMRNLSCDVTPGCKILIKGPVTCRRGMLLLTEGTAELLGGEVDELVVANSLPALLASALGINVTADIRQSTVPSTGNPSLPTQNPTIPTQTSTLPNQTPTLPIQNKPVAVVTSMQLADTHFDDDFDVDQLAAIEEEFVQPKSKRPLTCENVNPGKKLKVDNNQAYNNREDDFPDDYEEYIANEDEDYLREMEQNNIFDDKYSRTPDNIEKRDMFENRECLSNMSLNRHESAAGFFDRKDLNSGFNKIKDAASVNRKDTKGFKDRKETPLVLDYAKPSTLFFDRNQDIVFNERKDTTSNLIVRKDITSDVNVKKDIIIISPEPYVYIKQIQELNEIDRLGRIFYVKAQILKLLSKLSVSKDGWSLKCTLIDGSACLDVQFTSDVLTELVGYSPEQMAAFKKEFSDKPEIKLKTMEALQKAKERLQILYCIIELTMCEVPKITALIPFQEMHGKIIKRRLTNI